MGCYFFLNKWQIEIKYILYFYYELKYGEYLNTNCFPLNKLAAANDWFQTPNSQCFPVLIFLSTDGTNKYFIHCKQKMKALNSYYVIPLYKFSY